MPKRNIELLTKVRDQIDKCPEQHHQGTWCTLDYWSGFDPGKLYPPLNALAEVAPMGDKFDCLTSACVAGWAVLLAPPELLEALPTETKLFWHDLGQELLGLTDEESQVLFLDSSDEEARRLLDVLIAGGSVTDIYDDVEEEG